MITNFPEHPTEKDYLDVINWQRQMLEDYQSLVQSLQKRIEQLELANAEYYRIASDALKVIRNYNQDIGNVIDELSETD